MVSSSIVAGIIGAVGGGLLGTGTSVLIWALIFGKLDK